MSCDLKGVQISDGELRLIVEHFFEVWHVPVTIDRVTVKSAADVIVHSARGHFAKREQGHFECLFAVTALGIACVKSRKEIESDRARKLWRVTKPAFLRVVIAIKLLISGL